MDTTRHHAIIGCGRVAPNHVDGFRQVPGYAIRWACDRRAAVARQFATEHGIPRFTSRVDEVLADPSVTSISVCVDHAQHTELVSLGLAAGKHVLVEKPLALQVSDGSDLIARAERAGLVLSVVSQHRYDTLVLAVRDWMGQGLLGTLVQATVSLQSNRPDSYYTGSYWRGTWHGEGGSALMNQGYHCLDVVRWLCGELRTHSAAMSRAVRTGIETEDVLCGVLQGAAGLLVTLSVSTSSHVTWRTRIDIAGDRGAVQFDLDHPGTLHHWQGGPELEALARAERDRSHREEPPGIDYYGVSHRSQIADFCRSVRSGEPMMCGPAEALTTLGLISDLYRMGSQSEAWARTQRARDAVAGRPVGSDPRAVPSGDAEAGAQHQHR